MIPNANLSIVVPTFARHNALKKLLMALNSQDLNYQDTPLRLQVLVIDNFLDLSNQMLIKEFSHSNKNIQLEYHYTGSRGANKARNLGLSLASGEIIVFIDDDCLPSNNLYCQMVYHLHKIHQNLTGIGGPYILPEKFSLIELADHNNSQTWLLKCQKNGTPYTSQLLGGNASYKRDHILPAMKFNENIIYGGAEFDFNLRLQMQGLKLSLNSELELIHEQNLSFFGLLRKSFKQGFGQALIERTLGKNTVDSFTAHINYSVNEFESSVHFSATSSLSIPSLMAPSLSASILSTPSISAPSSSIHSSSSILFILESIYSLFFEAGKFYGYQLSKQNMLQDQRRLGFKMIYYAFRIFFGAVTRHDSVERPNQDTEHDSTANFKSVTTGQTQNQSTSISSPSNSYFPEHKRRIPQFRFYSIYYWTRHRVVRLIKKLLLIN